MGNPNPNDVIVDITTDNITETLRLFHEKILQGLEACGLQAERYAKMKAPVDTGRLRNSITHIVSGDPARVHRYTISQRSKYDRNSYDRRGRRKRLTRAIRDAETRTENIPATAASPEFLVVGTNVEYALANEIGFRFRNHFIPARPYLRPALADHKEEYKTILEYYLTH